MRGRQVKQCVNSAAQSKLRLELELEPLAWGQAERSVGARTAVGRAGAGGGDATPLHLSFSWFVKRSDVTTTTKNWEGGGR